MINQDRIELSVNANLTIPTDRWSPDNRGAEIKKLADALTQRGEIVWLRVASLNPRRRQFPQARICQISR
jgi:hypothetical protein